MNLYYLRNIIKYLIKESIGAETSMNVVGKKIGEVFIDNKGISEIRNKTITYAKFFPSTGDFSAISNAEEYLKSEGFVKGSMYMDYPIGFIQAGKFGVNDQGESMIVDKWGDQRPFGITKWDRMSQELINNLNGVIIPAPSEGMRDGSIYVVFFEFPN